MNISKASKSIMNYCLRSSIIYNERKFEFHMKLLRLNLFDPHE
jgi:hypothetical protein